ncbi:MAG: SpoIIE family protein phosphatase [Crocinitomicaceae bacterium]
MNLKNIALILLIIAGSLMTFLIYDINDTENSLAESLTEKPMENAQTHLDGFFEPVEYILLTSKDHAMMGYFDSLNPLTMNTYFSPIINHFPQVSSMGLANTTGFEYDLIPSDSLWDHRIVHIDEWGSKEKWSKWQFDSLSQSWNMLKEWEGVVKNDPRDRPWFQGALAPRSTKIHWTDPYIYNTTFEVGMTASLNWNRPTDSLDHIMAFDLTLADVTTFTQQINVSENGKVFILTNDGKYVGLPKDKALNSKEDIQAALLKSPEEAGINEVADFYEKWLTELDESEKANEFYTEGAYWWGKIIKYPISKEDYFLVGVLVPETDILSDLQHSKRIIIGSFAFVLVLVAFLMYSYGQTRKANNALSIKHAEITQQKLIIEEKNQDIMGSILYAKRLQNAILPSITSIQACFPESFVFYRPKDVVAGDFYWMEKVGDVVYLAAADCTGHGVPGAMVSFVCSNALSKSLVEESVSDVGKLLDRTRELVINRFGKSQEQIRDGMDISLVAINLKTLEIQWAGANNPLWIIRKNPLKSEDPLQEIKADKQPIGKYAKANPFTTHQMKLSKGDTLYLFSDGFPDQFGGEKGKKYKSKVFKEFLLQIRSVDMPTQESEIEKEFEKWKGDFEQVDDVCVIGVRM